MRFVKKLPLLCLVTSILTPLAFAEEQNDINGFAVLGGIANFGGEFGDAMDDFGSDTNALAISGSYTWRNGIGLGLTSSSMIDTGDVDLEVGHANFYASYTFTNNLKLLAGVGYIVGDSSYYGSKNHSGLMLGVGYTLPVGISFEIQHSMVELNNNVDGNVTNILVGYKW